ncbi:hypothetical protein P4B35_18770 [Pontiellaceae bacterium B12227]|nr:hypothetical protein [Pontiellaceae bacterium B12227]
MKLLIFLFFLSAMPTFAADAFRTFTSADGRTLKAKILSYDERKEKVEIQREDNRKLTVSPASFSEKDQTHIRKWYAAQVFMSPNLFQLEVKRKETGSTKKEHEVDVGEDGGGGGRRGGGETGVITVAIDKRTTYKFNLTLENKSNTQLNGITIEYRIYYDQQKAVLDEKANKGRAEDSDRPERYMAVDALKAKESRARLKPAEAKSRRTVSTTSVTLLERSASRSWGDKIDLKSNLHGAWIRLTMKGPDGEVLTRDVASSNSIMKKFPWEVPDDLLVQDQPAD